MMRLVLPNRTREEELSLLVDSHLPTIWQLGCLPSTISFMPSHLAKTCKAMHVALFRQCNHFHREWVATIENLISLRSSKG